MPIHDWTKVESGYFHSFHQRWISAIADALNLGVLPPEYLALSEKRNDKRIPDVLTLRWDEDPPAGSSSAGGVALMASPVQARIVQDSDDDVYADMADRIVVQASDGEVVAILEIVSPGNKHSRANFKEFLEKSVQYIRSKVSLFVIDVFPPSPRDPAGVHAAIWDELGCVPATFPAGKDRAVMSYDAGVRVRAHVEPFAVGDVLPDMPLFLGQSKYVMLPVQTTYDATWAVFPAAIKRRLAP